MELPKTIRKPLAINPHTMLIFSPPKTGKTTILAQLKNSLLLELEPNGADYVEGCILDISDAKAFNESLVEIKKQIKDNGGKFPYQYLIIDTLTKLDEWSEIVGTYNYMKKSQGQKFNREEGKPNGIPILHTDKRFETVHELPNGFGYVHSRNQMIDWYDDIITLAPYIIFVAHVKDKLIESKNGDTVEASDINLTGKVKSIISSKVDAVGLLRKEGKKCFINFNNEYKVVSGGRCSHLDGEILISEKLEDGTIKTYWEKIFIK